MHTSWRSIGAWAPFTAALSMIAYAVALDLWPLWAGHLFASLFRLDPFTLRPLHGWAAALPGVALWIAACYGVAAAAWVLSRRAARGRRPLTALTPARAAHPHS